MQYENNALSLLRNWQLAKEIAHKDTEARVSSPKILELLNNFASVDDDELAEIDLAAQLSGLENSADGMQIQKKANHNNSFQDSSRKQDTKKITEAMLIQDKKDLNESSEESSRKEDAKKVTMEKCRNLSCLRPFASQKKKRKVTCSYCKFTFCGYCLIDHNDLVPCSVALLVWGSDYVTY